MLRPTYPIETPRLLLRPLTPGDEEALYDVQSRPEVARYLYWEPRSRERVREVLADRDGRHTLEAEGDVLVLAMTLKDSHDLIGTVNLAWLSSEHRQGEIGFALHPDRHGRGLAREAAEVMLRLGFDSLGLRRVIGRCDARNGPSAGLMERLGMRREAHFRQNEFVKGEWCDELVYAMLASEWRP